MCSTVARPTAATTTSAPIAGPPSNPLPPSRAAPSPASSRPTRCPMPPAPPCLSNAFRKPPLYSHHTNIKYFTFPVTHSTQTTYLPTNLRRAPGFRPPQPYHEIRGATLLTWLDLHHGSDPPGDEFLLAETV